MSYPRKVRMGLVGGAGGFIGQVHRMAAGLDGEIELVCGAFSSSPEKSREAGAALYLPPERVYGSCQEMLSREKGRDDGMDFLSIVTPNHLHAEIATAALLAGFHVLCEKPMTTNLASAEQLVHTVAETGKHFCLMHNYSGYPMVKEARERIRNGSIGDIRKVLVEYPQGWLAGDFASAGVKHQSWKLDPELAGGSCCLGDIGTHAFHLAEYVTGLQVTELCADLSVFVDYKPLEDDANILLHLSNGARGILYASQVSINDENSLAFRIYGSKGGLEWHQEEPNTLIAKWPDRPREVIRTGSGNAYLSAAALGTTRIPAGHPEGFVEAFANIYWEFARAVRESVMAPTSRAAHDFPSAVDGLRGIVFVNAAWESQRSTGQKWFPLPCPPPVR
ncbi:MAG: Gfo/Idh/MocA family oxidoreductase [Victivallales bacterium]|nr:Gfo/Idh/MocA family oxidoreductase [Victivallales bacterium]